MTCPVPSSVWCIPAAAASLCSGSGLDTQNLSWKSNKLCHQLPKQTRAPQQLQPLCQQQWPQREAIVPLTHAPDDAPKSLDICMLGMLATCQFFGKTLGKTTSY